MVLENYELLLWLCHVLCVAHEWNENGWWWANDVQYLVSKLRKYGVCVCLCCTRVSSLHHAILLLERQSISSIEISFCVNSSKQFFRCHDNQLALTTTTTTTTAATTTTATTAIFVIIIECENECQSDFFFYFRTETNEMKKRKRKRKRKKKNLIKKNQICEWHFYGFGTRYNNM